MILLQELRRRAREMGLALDLVEKDYVMGWILFAVSSSSFSNELILKGGTALSKVYLPLNWRLSEDLDFTIVEKVQLSTVSKGLTKELPSARTTQGLTMEFRDEPYVNPNYLQAKLRYTGLLGKNTVKIEVSKEAFIGDVTMIHVPRMFDYPEFDVLVYTLENILAEKMRSLIERQRVRDYYDVWRLLRERRADIERGRELFIRKCESREIQFQGVDQFFPEGVAENLKAYLRIGLTRLCPEPVPPIDHLLSELREGLVEVFG